MTDFKVGDKVLVEAIFSGYLFGDKKTFVQFKSYKGESCMTPVQPDTIHPCKTYGDGLNDAWDLVAKVVLTCEKDRSNCDRILEDIFGTADLLDIFENYTADDAIDRFKEWEDEAKFHVGDVVTDCEGSITGVITRNDYEKYSVLWEDGGTDGDLEDVNLKKTGRTICIGPWLEQVRSDMKMEGE